MRLRLSLACARHYFFFILVNARLLTYQDWTAPPPDREWDSYPLNTDCTLKRRIQIELSKESRTLRKAQAAHRDPTMSGRTFRPSGFADPPARL